VAAVIAALALNNLCKEAKRSLSKGQSDSEADSARRIPVVYFSTHGLVAGMIVDSEGTRYQAARRVPAVTDRLWCRRLSTTRTRECRQETGEPTGSIRWSIPWSANPSSGA
jgi:hypothetical protein